MFDHFKLILNYKTYKIPLFFDCLYDINQNIYDILISKQEYFVRSRVNGDIFEIFINYLIKTEVTDINFNYIDQYEKLSEEFGVMQNIINIFWKNHPKQDISLSLNNISSLKKELSRKKEELKNKTIKYHQIIDHIFKNTINYDQMKSPKNKKRLFQAFIQEDTKFVDLFTKRKVTNENGLVFSLNVDEKTAILFQNMSTKSEVYIPRTINYESEEFVVTSISESCFLKSSIETIEFDKNSEIQTIGDFSFSSSSIKSIAIPSSVTKIGECAFYLCASLQNVSFSNNSKLISIGNGAFSKSALKSIEIPPHVTEIGEKAFNNCNMFSSIQFSNESKLKFIKEFTFTETHLSKISIPKSVIQIGKNSFLYCKKLNEVEFLDSSCSIEKRAFYGSDVKSIKMASNVFLKEGWCEGMESLESVSIIQKEEENIQNFEGKFVLGKSDPQNQIFDVILFAPRNIKEAVIPPFIERIGENSFENCRDCQKIEFSKYSKLRTVGQNAFQNCIFESIIIPSQVSQISMLGFNHSRLNSLEFSENSEIYSFGEYIFSWSNLTSLSIPSSIVEFKE